MNSLDNQGGCVCPLCGEYEGEPASVEAHISSRVDDDHRGSVGEHYRAELVASGDVEDDPATASTYESSAANLAEPGETTAYEGVDVDPGRALLAGTVLFAVVVAWYAVQPDDRPDDQPDDQEPEPESELIQTAGVTA